MPERFCGITEGTRVSSPSSTTTYMFEIECLHEDILGEILDHVILLKDFIRFGAVCKRWCNVFKQKKRHRIEGCNHEVPWLFVPTPFMDGEQPRNYGSNFNNNNLVQSRNLLDLFGEKWYNCFSPTIYGPRDFDLQCSSYGWLATLIKDVEVSNIILNNPITGNIISLPPLPPVHLDYPDYNVVLSCNPCIHPDKCLVAYFIDLDRRCSMGIMRLGGKTWTELRTKPLDSRIRHILFHNGKLYALLLDGQLFVFDCHWGSNNGDKCDFEMRHIVKTSKTLKLFSFVSQFLVESARGDLLMIETQAILNSRAISMYKLVITYNDGNEKMKGDWVGIHRIGNGDEVLFMSKYSFECVLASKCLNLQPNSAYIFHHISNWDDRYYYCREIRKYRLDTSERQPGESTGYSVTVTLKEERGGNRHMPPLWINPTLQ